MPEEITFNPTYDDFLEMLKKDKDSPELDDGWKLAKQLWTTSKSPFDHSAWISVPKSTIS